MAASVRRPSELAVLAVALVGCTEELPPIEGTTSLAIELVAPADPGTPDDRVPDQARAVTVRVRALDTRGELDASFAGEVEMYAHYLGSLTPRLGSREPLATATLEAGESPDVALELPIVYGPTFLWVEDGGSGTYATGTSPAIWYRNPFLADVSRPLDEREPTALERSPLEEKQIDVTGSRHGEVGRLVVTGVYAQGYTLADVACQDAAGTPPCVAGDYDAVFVFSFSRPQSESGRRLSVGDRIERLTGAVSEFNGLTEVNFPQSFSADEAARPDTVPAPVVLDPAWLADGADLGEGPIFMERNEAGLIAVDNATVCPLDDDFDTFGQWKLDVGNGCPTEEGGQDGTFINIISKGQVTEFRPEDHVGEVLPRVVGTLRPVSTSAGGFNVWILYPRTIEDLE